ncbi:MAG: FAD-binding oxidoreductase [Bacteroidetes bacterium]|nr:FAD-binding oxidoreductase [Bacteroidota bacterium]MCL5027263.1 FAD-binding oxidoreductase [Chloroflexota bacterium]
METDTLVRGLQQAVGDAKVRHAHADLLCYSYDSSLESQMHQWLPQAVVIPRSIDDVVSAVRFAAQHGVPITPRGAATGQTAGCVAPRGGIIIDMSQMNHILELDADDLQVIIEPGVVHANLNEFLAKKKLLFPPDPGSSKMCTVGGMVANNSRGMRAVKYGSTGDYVLGIKLVMADGQLITTGSMSSRAVQSSSGIDLTKLFVGSEGMLGVFVQLRLKVIPAPQTRGLVLAVFDRLEDSGQSVLEVFRAGILPSAIEILDASAIKAVNIYRPSMDLPEADAILLYEVDGNPESVKYDGQRIAEIVRPLARTVEWSDEKQRVNALWEARSLVGAASGQVVPGAARVYAGEDISVPIARVPETLRAIRNIGEKHNIVLVTYGHVGSGNMHTAPVIHVNDADQVRRVGLVADEIHHLALKIGGTVTGEHGVGVTRIPYMREEHGPALDVMWKIKQALDPQNIMNPGKTFSPEEFK